MSLNASNYENSPSLACRFSQVFENGTKSEVQVTTEGRFLNSARLECRVPSDDGMNLLTSPNDIKKLYFYCSMCDGMCVRLWASVCERICKCVLVSVNVCVCVCVCVTVRECKCVSVCLVCQGMCLSV